METEERFAQHQYTSGRMMGSCSIQIESKE